MGDDNSLTQNDDLLTDLIDKFGGGRCHHHGPVGSFRNARQHSFQREDARRIDIRDNDWLECFNVNGVVMAKAVVSPRIPPGKAFMYHAQERLINTPGSKLSGQRGGTHNSVTRIMVKPTHMIGGYAQLSYGFNYYGPIGSQRDEIIIVRKAGEVDWYED